MLLITEVNPDLVVITESTVKYFANVQKRGDKWRVDLIDDGEVVDGGTRDSYTRAYELGCSFFPDAAVTGSRKLEQEEI